MQETFRFPDATQVMRLMLAQPLPEGHTLRQYAARGWIADRKWDGVRVELYVWHDAYEAWARPRGRALPNRKELPPHLDRWVKWLPDGLYDGEKVSSENGNSWKATRKDLRDVSIIKLFDVMALQGHDLRPLPYRERREYLAQAVRIAHERAKQARDPLRQQPPVTVSAHVPTTQAAVTALWKAGYEGVVLKDPESRYLCKRSDQWLKVKRRTGTPVTVIGFLEGLTGPHSRLWLKTDAGVEISAKRQDDGFEGREAELIGRRVMVEHFGVTESGKLRSPMFQYVIPE